MISHPLAPAAFDVTLPPDVRFGQGRVGEVAPFLVSRKVRRVLLVTGRAAWRAEPVHAALGEAGVEATVVRVAGEPSVDVVRAVVSTATEAGCDAVLGLGGGSVLDVAKATAILAGTGADPLDHLEVVGRGLPIPRPGLPWIAVPTTAGTGSEVTRNAVLSTEGVKASLRSPLMLARLAVVDPDLLAGAPRSTIAASGLDALSQLIEPYLSNRATAFTDPLAREGISRSARSLREAWWHGLDDAPALREDLALASLFGGVCLANAGLGVVHGLAGVLGGRLEAAHGALCAALLPATLEVNRRALVERAPDHPALARMDELGALLTGRADAVAEDAVAWVRELSAELEVPSLTAVGLRAEDVSAVAEAGLRASSTQANPIPLTLDELAEILQNS